MQTDRKLKARKRRITRDEALRALVGDKHAALKLFKDSAIHIIMARNGALLVAQEGADVFEFEENSLYGLQSLHYGIDVALGFLGSKYDRQRLQHVIEHGNNYECEDRDCLICHDPIAWTCDKIDETSGEKGFEHDKDEKTQSTETAGRKGGCGKQEE